MPASTNSHSQAKAPSASSGTQSQGSSGNMKSSFTTASQQIFPGSVVGSQGVGGVSGGGLLMTAPNNLSAVLNPLSSALNMVSNEDDSVFSPSSVDDERMKIIEKVYIGPLSISDIKV